MPAQPDRQRTESPGGSSHRWGSAGGGAGVGIVVASAALGAAATIAMRAQPGRVLGACIVGGTVLAALAVRPRSGRLIFPVPVLSYLIAALIAGIAYNRSSSKTELVIGGAQWVANGFFAMTVATVLAIVLITARWLLGRRYGRASAGGEWGARGVRGDGQSPRAQGGSGGDRPPRPAEYTARPPSGSPGPDRRNGTYPDQRYGQYPGQGNGPYPGQGNGPYPGQGNGPYPGQGNGPYPGQGNGQHAGRPQGPRNGQYPDEPPGPRHGQYPDRPAGHGQYPGRRGEAYPDRRNGQYPDQPAGQPYGQYPERPAGQQYSQYGQYGQYPDRGNGRSPGQSRGPYPDQDYRT
jgi:hypothetical protein